jgi:hypothetical protein
MENDNLYLNDGEYFMPSRPPLKQQRDLKTKRDETIQQLPLLKEMLERLEDKIAATDSVKEAIKVAETYGTSTGNALIGLDIARQQLEAERSYLIGRIDSV